MYQTHPEPSKDEAGWTRDDWNTPEWILAAIRRFAGGRIGLDPCSNVDSTVDAETSWTKEDDALVLDWNGHGLAFVNPPYSRELYPLFAAKILEQGGEGVEIVALVPTNCETEAWQDAFWLADAVCFLNRRVRYLKRGEIQGSPAGGSALVYFGPRVEEFAKLFQDEAEFGKVVFPAARTP